MKILLDSNILLRLSQPGHPHEAESVESADLLQHHHVCVVVPQTIYEYWVVATRPTEVNGLGFDPAFAAEERDRFLELFPLLRDERSVYELWRQLVEDYHIKGVRAHDARYVAALKRHRMSHLLSFNERHFRTFEEVVVLTPSQVVAQARANQRFVQELD